jgi:AcrR family transcriptional regulator
MSRAGIVAWPSRSLKEGALIIDIFVIFDKDVNLMAPTIHADSVLTDTAPPTRGHKKRSRTRQTLLDAALRVLAESGEGFSLTEVAARAGVSHGTFYNYFRDRDELMDALVMYSVEEFAVRTGREVDSPDPAVRFAVISARALRTAINNPSTMRVALRIEAVQRALLTNGPLSYLRADLVEGHRTGRFTGTPDDGMLDVIVGALVLAGRRGVDGESNDAYVSSVLTRLLMSLGVDKSEAQSIATQATAH